MKRADRWTPASQLTQAPAGQLAGPVQLQLLLDPAAVGLHRLDTDVHFVGDLLDKPRHQALPALQRLLVKALGDKQEVAFSGGATIMKIIGG